MAGAGRQTRFPLRGAIVCPAGKHGWAAKGLVKWKIVEYNIICRQCVLLLFDMVLPILYYGILWTAIIWREYR